MAESRAWVTVVTRLECGCQISHTLSSTHGIGHLEKVLQLAADCLPHQFDRTEDTHRCELVDDDNPNGTAQKRDN